ncbi:hypothetical protein ACKVMH_03695 [Lysobacter zhanggongensis]|uniref:Uncharacterized protein n=1 Tax=Lysobacter zhanggongensis TaxID=1774951 RepID=A0ABU7YNZ6_9GAMM
MILIRSAAVVLMAFALVACEKQPAADTTPQAADTQAPADAAAPATPAVPADQFLSGLALAFPHEVTNQRQVRQKGGGRAEVFAIDFTEGTIQEIDAQLADALAGAGFERGDVQSVPGGIRVAYVAEDGRRVSTKIRNKKYFRDRIADSSVGQISLSYIPN